MLKIIGIAGFFSVVAMGMANAASVTNKDSEAHTLVVTEDGVKSEIVIAQSETLSICASGCFITMPNGDRAALSGDETVEIVGGGAVVK